MNWKLASLGDITTIKGGGTPSRKVGEYWNGCIPWASVKDFSSNELNSTLESISEEGLKKSSTNLIPENTIIIPTRMALGKVAINKIPVAINQDLKALFIKFPEKVDIKYLAGFLRSKSEFIERNGSGATVKGVTLDLIKNIPVPLPPLEDQKRIVELLDRARALIDKRKEQIGLMDQLIQSLFYDMFGDPVTNPMGWEIKKLADIGELKRGKSKHRPRNDPSLLGGPYPLVQTGDISNAGLYLTKYSQTYSELGLAQSKIWPKNTLCITIAANIAKTSILTFDACFPDSVVAFVPKNGIDKMYIQLWFGFLQKIIEATAPESAQKNINLKILSELDIPVAPFELQNSFADRVQEIEAQKEAMTTSLRELENNFNSISQRAFKGEL